MTQDWCGACERGIRHLHSPFVAPPAPLLHGRSCLCSFCVDAEPWRPWYVETGGEEG